MKLLTNYLHNAKNLINRAIERQKNGFLEKPFSLPICSGIKVVETFLCLLLIPLKCGGKSSFFLKDGIHNLVYTALLAGRRMSALRKDQTETGVFNSKFFIRMAL